jgi:hypothetical protein
MQGGGNGEEGGGGRKDGRQWPAHFFHILVTGLCDWRSKEEAGWIYQNTLHPREAGGGSQRRVQGAQGTGEDYYYCIIEGLRLFWAQVYSRAQ